MNNINVNLKVGDKVVYFGGYRPYVEDVVEMFPKTLHTATFFEYEGRVIENTSHKKASYSDFRLYDKAIYDKMIELTNQIRLMEKERQRLWGELIRVVPVDNKV